MEDCRRSIQINSQYTSAFKCLGNALDKQAKVDEAIEVCKEPCVLVFKARRFLVALDLHSISRANLMKLVESMTWPFK